MDLSNRAAYAEGQQKNLRVQWESCLFFCLYFNLVSLPACTKNLQLFAQFLYRTFKSVNSIKNYINGIKTMHLLLGYETDHINKYILNLSLKGIAKLNPYSIRQAEPMTPSILLNIAEIMNFSYKFNLVYWCLFLFAFFLLARKSNLVPTLLKDLKEKKFLLRKDIKDCGDYLIVSFKWTKTIQKGETILRIPLFQIKDSILCPVFAYRVMCKAVPAHSDSPLFMLPNNKVITYSLYQSKLRYFIQNVGLDPTAYSSHSMRRGRANLLFKANIPEVKIQLMGDWKSMAYKNYLSFSLEDKIKLSKLMGSFAKESSVKFLS